MWTPISVEDSSRIVELLQRTDAQARSSDEASEEDKLESDAAHSKEVDDKDGKSALKKVTRKVWQ